MSIHKKKGTARHLGRPPENTVGLLPDIAPGTPFTDELFRQIDVFVKRIAPDPVARGNVQVTHPTEGVDITEFIDIVTGPLRCGCTGYQFQLEFDKY